MKYTAEDFEARRDRFAEVPGGIDDDIVLAALRIAANVMRPGTVGDSIESGLANVILYDHPEKLPEDAAVVRSFLTGYTGKAA